MLSKNVDHLLQIQARTIGRVALVNRVYIVRGNTSKSLQHKMGLWGHDLTVAWNN